MPSTPLDPPAPAVGVFRSQSGRTELTVTPDGRLDIRLRKGQDLLGDEDLQALRWAVDRAGELARERSGPASAGPSTVVEQQPQPETPREPWTFTRREGEPFTLVDAVYEAVGGASTCWENLRGAGTFDSGAAEEIAEALISEIREVRGRDTNALLRLVDSSGAVAELVEAIRLTVEYLGTEALPPVEGWSWFDALRKYAPHLADEFVAQRGRGAHLVAAAATWDPDAHPDPVADMRVLAERARRGELPDRTAERAADDAAAVHRASMSALVDFLVARFAEDPRGVAPDGPWLREASPYELRRAAVRYAGHPDYREEWRPEPAPGGGEFAPVLPFGPVDPETARLMLWYAVEALVGVPDADERVCAVAEERVQRLAGRATAMWQAAGFLRGSAELSAQLDEQQRGLAAEAALDRHAAEQLLTVVREMAGLSPETRAERQLLGARFGGR